MKLLITLFLLCSPLLQATIIEMAHFDELPSYVDKDTLLILDIDDTLLIPQQMLGCDEWFLSRLKQQKEAGKVGEQILEDTLAEFEAIRHLSTMELVEKGTDRIVDDLQRQGFVLMGLTTQGLGLATRTVMQLKENQIDLTRTAPCQEEHLMMNNGQGILYRKGVLFTAGTSKGEALFLLCQQMNLKLSRIVFVNDKRENLADIERSAAKRHVPFIGLRYAFSDARKKAFDPQIADFQFKHSSFAKILSDEEAALQMESRR